MSAAKSVAQFVGLVRADTGDTLTPRQRLRTAISAANAARAELEVLETATAYNGEAAKAVEAAEAAVEQSKATLATSKVVTAQAFVARALGAPEGSGITIQQARLELQVSEDELEAAIAARQALKDLIPDAKDKLQHAEWKVNDAAKAVIMAEVSPHAVKIWEHHAGITREAKELDQVVDWLGRLNKVIGHSHLPIPYVNAYDGAADVWREAEKADAKLPPIPGAEPAPPAKR